MDGEEALHLQKVQALIDAECRRMASQQQDEKREIREQNRAFLAEHPFASVYGRAEALRRENENRCETIEELERKRALLQRMRRSPYFGRVDFVFDGEDAAEKLYIGVATLTDFATNEILIYDWRAPVSALFYMGEIGPAAYQAPAGEITGEITRIRQYRFRDGSLQSYWDADLQIDDAVLRDVLSGSADGQMRAIVSTIQREQNRAIRFDPKKNLAVFGPAGCGKTSIGMHRLSWLLYQLRAAGYAPTVAMFTNNAAFRAYVSGVLPELGELNAQMKSFPALFGKYLKNYSVEPALTQTETLLRGNKRRQECVKELYDPAFLRFVDEALEKTTLRFQAISLYGDVIVPAKAPEERFAGLPKTVPVKRRLETVSAWVAEEIENYFLRHKKEILAQIINEMEMGDSSAEHYRRLKDRLLAEARQMVGRAAADDPAALAVSFFETYYQKEAAAFRAHIDEGRLWFEEAVFLLYLSVRLGSCALQRAPDHVLVDEAQDYAPIQHRLLRALYPKAVFTVLADGRQGVSPETNTDEKTLAEIYGADTVEIKKSYRATRQLSEFSKQFLPPEKADYTAFQREGPPPFRHQSADPVRTAAEILRGLPAACVSACVILKTTDRAAAFGAALKAEIPGVSVVCSEKKIPAGSVLCMPVTLTKGLEFDAVILPEADDLLRDPRLAYLASTRALHQLHLIKKE